MWLKIGKIRLVQGRLGALGSPRITPHAFTVHVNRLQMRLQAAGLSQIYRGALTARDSVVQWGQRAVNRRVQGHNEVGKGSSCAPSIPTLRILDFLT